MDNTSKVSHKADSITFIDRKKSTPIFQNNFENFKKYLLAKNYKDEKILYRIIYDKIYRPDLYNFILKGGKKNLNLARNIYSANEDKYEYKTLKSNESFNFEDDQLFSENNYITKLHNFYVFHKLTIYSSVPLGFFSVYYKLANKNTSKFNLCVLISATIFFVNIWNYRKKDKYYTSEIHKYLENANINDIDTYKRFYYD
jgi:hypothetical protein